MAVSLTTQCVLCDSVSKTCISSLVKSRERNSLGYSQRRKRGLVTRGTVEHITTDLTLVYLKCASDQPSKEQKAEMSVVIVLT